MPNIAKQFAVVVASTSLVFAPFAAQANTRAGDSGVVYSAADAGPGLGRADDGESLVGTPGIFAIILAAAAAVGIILLIDGSDNQSPGAN